MSGIRLISNQSIYSVSIDSVRYLIAKELGVSSTTLDIEFILEPVDYDGPGCPSYKVSHIKATTPEIKNKL